ncbi:hypothetical protein ACQ4LE_002379 [Meloidogyne hapla]
MLIGNYVESNFTKDSYDPNRFSCFYTTLVSGPSPLTCSSVDKGWYCFSYQGEKNFRGCTTHLDYCESKKYKHCYVCTTNLCNDHPPKN